MAYFTGHNLVRKVREYDLEELDDALQVFTDSGYWPGELEAEADTSLLEPMRVVMYSLLHKHGIKEQFVVKVKWAARLLTIDLKMKADDIEKLRSGGLKKADRPAQEDAPNLRQTIFGDEEELDGTSPK